MSGEFRPNHLEERQAIVLKRYAGAYTQLERAFALVCNDLRARSVHTGNVPQPEIEFSPEGNADAVLQLQGNNPGSPKVHVAIAQSGQDTFLDRVTVSRVIPSEKGEDEKQIYGNVLVPHVNTGEISFELIQTLERAFTA